MSFIPRLPEQPTWALMLNPGPMNFVCVREQFVENKLTCGWVVVARESELLPFNPPRLIPESEPLPQMRISLRKADKTLDKPEGDGA